MSSSTRVLRIRVSKRGEPKVTIGVPLGLARFVRVGGVADQISARYGIDLDEILRGIEELPDGKIVDVVDEKSGDHVEISLEMTGAVEADTPTVVPAEAYH
jgi:hypothetical protein